MSPSCGFGLGSWITTSSCSWFWWALLQRVWSTMSKDISKPTLSFLLDNISALTVCKLHGFCTRFNFDMDCHHQAHAVNVFVSALDIIRRFFHWCCRNHYHSPKYKIFLCVMWAWQKAGLFHPFGPACPQLHSWGSGEDCTSILWRSCPKIVQGMTGEWGIPISPQMFPIISPRSGWLVAFSCSGAVFGWKLRRPSECLAAKIFGLAELSTMTAQPPPGARSWPCLQRGQRWSVQLSWDRAPRSTHS